MQRSSSNSVNHRQTTLPSSSSSVLNSSNRRNYNRSHNNFKFHNFVFNETNQKFCLEEQDGNKKITVLHWKSSTDDDHKQQQQQQQLMNHQSMNIRQCDSDSKLIKSEKYKFTPSIPSNVAVVVDDDDDEQQSTIDNRIDTNADDDDDDGDRSRFALKSSASFPFTKNVAETSPMNLAQTDNHHDKQRQIIIDKNQSNQKYSSFLPHLVTGGENSSFISSDFNSISSSGSNYSSFHLNSLPLQLSSSSSGSNYRYGMIQNDDLHKYYHQCNSGSSIGTRTTTTTTSSSSCSANINFSLDNLRLNENRTFRHRRKNNVRRKTARIPSLNHRPIIVDDDNNENEDDEDDDIDSAVDSDHDSDDFDDDEDDLFYRTYRRKIQQRLESIMDEQHQQAQQQQQQPLDLSLKKYAEDMENDDNNNNNLFSKDLNTRCDNNNDDDDKRYSNLNKSSMNFTSHEHQIRKDVLSPSTLISSIKCCSPSSMDNNNNHYHSSSSNPFVFNQPCSISTTTTTTTTTETRLLDNYHTSIPSTSFSSSSCHDHHQSPRFCHTKSTDIFDALLEEEIQKFLHNSTGTSTSTSIPMIRKQTNEFDRKIEDKLKKLQQEIIANNQLISDSDIYQFMSDSFNDNDHLRMHFKFDSNKNLEPYLVDSGYRTIGTRGSSSLREFSSPSPSSSSSLLNTLPRSRLNHRNQIRRHLEDAFKQNGFLVKTKQVSDANNSAMFCKFRQLRKYTRYYLKSWHNHLPDEVNKLWKGFLPPKSERPTFLSNDNQTTTTTSSSMASIIGDDDDNLQNIHSTMAINSSHLME
ncbi:hypothetical protein HUG17_4029 [Dermatophagoides farinae]|uniref:Uncharacterized protein n=1 Tax=Dermatophagoides farinae TaxID=6954 RepID=A0A9D4SFP0_DERFA|nr:probable serine/threonine-protein kinase DDB_G0282963 [Dermatophagoides farinae]KAH7639996.1 hypothetical protein HUG17_4029 [Dermatophagoides farinae]